MRLVYCVRTSMVNSATVPFTWDYGNKFAYYVPHETVESDSLGGDLIRAGRRFFERINCSVNQTKTLALPLLFDADITISSQFLKQIKPTTPTIFFQNTISLLRSVPCYCETKLVNILFSELQLYCYYL